ncbi:MAG: flagellar basal body P-ring formation chaperone FlgA [Gemmatimonadaceae bacterium]|nr:flagellar basal body P-ring formation chaperone FlgA [Gemmatimonadaceae bacterium]
MSFITLLAAGVVATAIVAAPLAAQSRATVDSLVSRITRSWGAPPRGGWCTEWSVVRGDSTALRADAAEISGSDRAGLYTITVRPAKYAAPVLVARLHVGHEREEPVAARQIARGTILGEQDVLVRHTLVWGAPDTTAAATSAAQLIGSEARRVLRDGEPIRANDVTGAPVVFAGDSVTAEIIRDGVRLALVGTALHNASLGARVAIRLDRGRRFAGVATGRNTVRLD